MLVAMIVPSHSRIFRLITESGRYSVCDIFSISFKGESIDIDISFQSIKTQPSCIVAFGATASTSSDVKVIVGKENVIVMPSLSTPIHFCFASYYVFNISFPLTSSLSCCF